MATLTVTATEDYTDGTPAIPANTTSIQFTQAGGFAIASFGSDQFAAGGGNISDTVSITGSAFSELIQVFMSVSGAFSAAGWTFDANWRPGGQVGVTGTSGDDIITGSVQPDQIRPGTGVDQTSGGDGNDSFSIGDLEFGAGEVIDGGAGTDRLLITDSGNYNFNIGTLKSIEELVFSALGNAKASFHGDQFAAGLIASNLSIRGDGFANTLRVFLTSSGTISAADWAFTSWTDGSDIVALVGSDGADTIIGSSRADTISGGGGSDNLSGGDGDDTFFYNGFTVVDAGEQIDGGPGTDRIQAVGSLTNLTGVTMTGIERLQFEAGNPVVRVVLRESQIGPGAITHVVGSASEDSLVVSASSNEDLSGVTFESWTDDVDSVGVNGTANGDVLIGSSRSDRILGEGGGDVLKGGPSNDTVDGGAGTDTAVFSGNAASYRFHGAANNITITGPDGSDTLIAIERLKFDNLTIDLTDSDPLFDTLFYFTENPDVFHAGVNALEHFNTFGAREARDPNAFFDTSFYLAVNPDVRASGVNPLDHFHRFGWKESRDPGPDFDTTLYLLRNPDVAAAGIDPLQHFLEVGQFEGRKAFQAIGAAVYGFDAQFYLFHNPDVAAAGVDPFKHYNQFGFHEGRNPNAFFDTAGYLAHNPDVAASGANPLAHYMTFGFKEGRDPSASFDTDGYLAANSDVAAAGVNPLQHFLAFGVYEGRQAVNDGLWS